jgi:hypothetical protein
MGETCTPDQPTRRAYAARFVLSDILSSCSVLGVSAMKGVLGLAE